MKREYYKTGGEGQEYYEMGNDTTTRLVGNGESYKTKVSVDSYWTKERKEKNEKMKH